ncbi:hypothetical protein [Acholeplasma granularum]|uniref:hypothetical protein n=1 Tax=Acholeplasma granularum TaxID=264635 RepID=UPI0004B716EE|nr:hypothetical protein [Acholeplasma granularum]
MLEYKSVLINKVLKKSIESAIDSTINDMVKSGWTFVQMTGTQSYAVILLFSRDKFGY